jgi:hypothetical protein
MQTTEENFLIILFATAWRISVAALNWVINVGYFVDKMQSFLHYFLPKKENSF